ncbi:MAG: dockerin type I repeat-containing protein [Clostridia bacterium]|nr:dockerin type I repeat-containing protein [Clostridia bacterium]
MKISKRILSSIMALLMVMFVCSAGLTAFAVESNGSILKEIVLEPTPRPQVQFYCTEVTRVAKGANSMEPGNQIVKATPSGVPELSGDHVSQAYSGEIPAATRITFVSPTAGVSITKFSCDNSTVTFSDTAFTAPGTYTIDVTGGTAEPGSAITFTIDYTWTDGNTYQEKCVTYVENIATGGAFAELRVTWKPYNGTSSWYRGYASAITRVLGKGVYYETPADAGMTQRTGSYNVATKAFTDGSGLTSYYEEERVESAGLFSNPRETIDHTKFITGTSQAHVYLDASVSNSLADINLRIDANVGNENGETHVRNNDTPNVALGESYVFAGAQTTAPSGYSTNSVAQATIGYSVPARSNYGFDSENGAYSTITSGTRNGGHIITSHLTGSVAGLVSGAAYTVVNRYYAYFRGSYAYITNSPIVPIVMTFHVVDKGALRDLVNHVMTSDPDVPTTRTQKKGANPQAWYYRSGFSAFQNAYVDSVRVLNNPKATQSEIDASTKSLQTMYNNLQLKTADYTRVNDLYDQADEIIDNEEAYPPSDIALIREAQEMVTKSYSILYQSAVDQMAENLQIAIDRAMPYAANYEDIYALKQQYDAMDKSLYPPEGIAAVDAAFAKVDYTLTALEQDKVDAWAAEIEDAMNNLAPLTANFDALITTLGEAKGIDRTLYINGSLLLDPMEAAEAAIADHAANPWLASRQDEVDALEQNLREKIDGLILRSVYKIDLKEAIDKEIPGTLEYYNQDILAEYQALVAEGTEMYNDDTLTIYNQAEIDAMTESITAKYDELMASYDDSCKHPIVEDAVVENNVDPDCVNAGSYDLVVYCSECGEEVSRETIVVDALGHTEGDAVIENKVAATATTDGSYDTVVYCTVCGEEISRETTVVPALGHTPAEAVEENRVEATCTEAGSYDMVVYCTCCTPAVELSRETITIDALGHTPAEAVEENRVEADCVTAGLYEMVVYCSVCGEELSRESFVIEALGHTEGEAVEENRVEATYEQAGSYDSVVYCTVCGEELSRETIVIPQLQGYFKAAEGSTTVLDTELGYIYGLDIGLADLEGYVEYSSSVSYETPDGIGTGMTLTTFRGGEEWETYTIIIFGDLNGDGVIDIYDSSILAAIVNGDIEIEEGDPILFAADLNGDTAIDIYDLAFLNAVVNGEVEIEQVPYV